MTTLVNGAGTVHLDTIALAAVPVKFNGGSAPLAPLGGATQFRVVKDRERTAADFK